jgi:hypothetical protein
MQVSPNAGQGEASVSVVVAENPAAIDRSGFLVVNGSRVAVSQIAAACRFELGSSSSRVSPRAVLSRFQCPLSRNADGMHPATCRGCGSRAQRPQAVGAQSSSLT